MIKTEEITATPSFTNQLEDKLLYANHSDDISISYDSTYTLKYVIEGVKHYHYNNQDIEVSRNQYLILNSDNRITTEAKKGTKGFSFFLSPKLINGIYQCFTTNNSSIEFIEIPQKKSNTRIHFLLDKIAFLYTRNQIEFKQQKDQLFIEIAELIVEEQTTIDMKFDKLKIVRHGTKKELFRLMTEVKEYPHDNLQENITLDNISREIGVSKYYLHRLFTEINGRTPLDYLTGIRMEKAKQKLQYSKESIFEIAIACGFDNTPYFSNTFKKYMNLSPSQFRKKV